MRDSEGVARPLRGTVGMTAAAVYREEDQARKRQQRNRVPHNGRHLGASVGGRNGKEMVPWRKIDLKRTKSQIKAQ